MSDGYCSICGQRLQALGAHRRVVAHWPPEQGEDPNPWADLCTGTHKPARPASDLIELRDARSLEPTGTIPVAVLDELGVVIPENAPTYWFSKELSEAIKRHPDWRAAGVVATGDGHE